MKINFDIDKSLFSVNPDKDYTKEDVSFVKSKLKEELGQYILKCLKLSPEGTLGGILNIDTKNNKNHLRLYISAKYDGSEIQFKVGFLE